jgi:hypothetical protein
MFVMAHKPGLVLGHFIQHAEFLIEDFFAFLSPVGVGESLPVFVDVKNFLDGMV